MSTNQQSFWVRNRWALPLLLVLIVAVVILAAIFGPKLRSAASATSTPTPMPSPTPAPTSVVTVAVTATPGPGTPTVVTTSNCPVGTPGTTGGASTPLPQATPVPTVVGLCLGMITRQQSKVQQTQSAASSGNPAYAYYLDPIAVVQHNLPNYGFTGPVKIVSPVQVTPSPTPYTGADGRPLVQVVVQYRGRPYTIQVAQPATRGPKGIWVIVTILPGRS